MPRAREIVTPMPERLAAAATAVTDARTALSLAIQQRNELVRESLDDGHLTQKATATAAGITVPRVLAILAQRDDDDDA